MGSRGPFSTDPVAWGGGRRNERTTGAEALRAGGPAAPYIRPLSSESSGGGGGLSGGDGSSAPPAGTPHAYITQQRPRRLCYPGPGSVQRWAASATASPAAPRHAPGPYFWLDLRLLGLPAKARDPTLESRPRIRLASCGGLRLGPTKPRRTRPAASLALCPATTGRNLGPARVGQLASPNLRRREKSQKSPMWRQLQRCLLCDRN